MALISVQEASNIMAALADDFGKQTIPLAKANGRILAEDLIADRDFPPFNRVAMDGIAIQYQDFAAGQTLFPVFATVAAGSPPPEQVPAQQCVEIMTGAVLPSSCDTVIRYEDLRMEDGQAKILIDSIQQKQNIHHQGNDRLQGDVLISAGMRMAAPEIGIAATIGKTKISVKTLPNIAIISTGDELVSIEEKPLPYQIRSSNTRQLAAFLQQSGFESKIFHLPDEPNVMKAKLEELLQSFPIIMLSGGVSKGKFDFIPQVLGELGLEKLLHRIAQRPGKPLWFGKHDKGVVFGLPGNPVSSFVGTIRYVLPFIRKSLGLSPKVAEYALLAEAYHFRPALTYFMPVKLKMDEKGQLWAHPQEQGGSGNLAKLSLADAFLELPADREDFSKDEAFPCWRYRL